MALYLVRSSCKAGRLDAVSDSTVHVIDVNGRPPLPYDAEASMEKSSQYVTNSGALTMTVGAIGLLGPLVDTFDSLAVGFRSQLAVPVQSALNLPVRVMVLDVFRYLLELCKSAMEGKDTLTVDALSHVHDDREAPLKENRESQVQVPFRPALSVKESKLITTAWPLSLN